MSLFACGKLEERVKESKQDVCNLLCPLWVKSRQSATQSNFTHDLKVSA